MAYFAQLGFGTQTLPDQRTEESTEESTDERTGELEGEDRERFSHYVPKDKLTEAMVSGTPVIALCGKVWVPSRDPQRFPVCPECKDIWEQMKSGGDADQ